MGRDWENIVAGALFRLKPSRITLQWGFYLRHAPPHLFIHMA